MQLLIAAGTVPLAQADTAPTSGTPGYATDGNPSATPPVPQTQFPAYAFNAIQTELVSLITAAGNTPSATDNYQILPSLMALLGFTGMYTVTGSGTQPTVYEWVASYTGSFRIRLWSGGASGGSGNGGAGGGGGGGGFFEAYIRCIKGYTYSVTIAAGGAASAAGAAGNNGGSTALAVTALDGVTTYQIVNLTGGVAGGAGVAGSNALGGAGGTVTVGSVAAGEPGILGQPHTEGGNLGVTGTGLIANAWQSGGGGDAPQGSGGASVITPTSTPSAGNAGRGPGAGSSGGCGTGLAPAGNPGRMILEYVQA